MWAAQYVNFKTPRRFVSSGGLGTMGFGMGAAMGASFGTGKGSVLITGDGSFGMSLQELATAVTHQVPMVILIFNNGVLGMVRQWQTLFFEKHYSSTVLERKTDFVALAKAFGAAGERVDSLDALNLALKRAFQVAGPYVIDCKIDADELVLPMLPPGGSLDDLITKVEGEKMSKYTVAVLVRNQTGVLNRVTSLFRRRQFNINALTVSETESNELSRITVVFEGEEDYKQQLVNQLYKLPDVCSIKEFNSDNSISCELLLIKIANEPENRDEIRTASEAFGAVVVDYSKESIMLRLTDESHKIDDFINLMREYTILEICRTGSVSLEKGGTTIRQMINF
jgi:acetolactate synthase small subunit